MATRTLGPRTYGLVYIATLVLLALTAGASFLNLGPFSVVVAFGVGMAKALLIMLYFMELVVSRRLSILAACVGFFWLGILFVLPLSDYLTRGQLPWSYHLGPFAGP